MEYKSADWKPDSPLLISPSITPTPPIYHHGGGGGGYPLFPNPVFLTTFACISPSFLLPHNTSLISPELLLSLTIPSPTSQPFLLHSPLTNSPITSPSKSLHQLPNHFSLTIPFPTPLNAPALWLALLREYITFMTCSKRVWDVRVVGGCLGE